MPPKRYVPPKRATPRELQAMRKAAMQEVNQARTMKARNALLSEQRKVVAAARKSKNPAVRAKANDSRINAILRQAAASRYKQVTKPRPKIRKAPKKTKTVIAVVAKVKPAVPKRSSSLKKPPELKVVAIPAEEAAVLEAIAEAERTPRGTRSRPSLPVIKIEKAVKLERKPPTPRRSAPARPMLPVVEVKEEVGPRGTRVTAIAKAAPFTRRSYDAEIFAGTGDSDSNSEEGVGAMGVYAPNPGVGGTYDRTADDIAALARAAYDNKPNPSIYEIAPGLSPAYREGNGFGEYGPSRPFTPKWDA